jgi:hypothetical protein
LLARLEAESLWRALLMRFPDVVTWTLAGTPRVLPGKTIRGLDHLPIYLGKEF